MIVRWFNIFTRRGDRWVPTVIPYDEHLWDFLVAMDSRATPRKELQTAAGWL